MLLTRPIRPRPLTSGKAAEGQQRALVAAETDLSLSTASRASAQVAEYRPDRAQSQTRPR